MKIIKIVTILAITTCCIAFCIANARLKQKKINNKKVEKQVWPFYYQTLI